MSCFIAVLKCILCVDDDDDRSSRQSLYAPLTRQSNSGVTNSSYSSGVSRDPELYTTALDRDPELYSRRNAPRTSQSNSGVTNSSYSTGVYRDPLLYTTALDRDPELYSRRNALPTGQSNSGVTNSSFNTCNDSYLRQEKSTVRYAAPTQLSRDEASKSRARNVVSGTDTFKLSSIPNRENIAKSLGSVNLSQNVTVNSIKYESPKPPPSFQPLKPPPISTKPTISVASSSSSIPRSKEAYVWVEQASTTYVFPKEIKSLIEKDIVPGVLKKPLSESSYKDYFHALLYAEDCYFEKWDGFEMKNVKVQLHEATVYTRRGKNRKPKNGEDKDEKFFVAFELDKIRDRRPFLISRDFVSLQPTRQTTKPFQGVIYRVVKSNLVLAEFKKEFVSRHHPDNKYDVKFSFNRVCLKRAHQAVAAASESLFRNLIFPDNPPKHELSSNLRCIYLKESLAVAQILRLQGLPPYLVEGPLAAVYDDLSKTGKVVVEAIIQILRADPSKKILLCAPMNRTCDVLMRGLRKEIAESEMFRANAAFREDVPEDILPSCLYTNTGDTECFSCPKLAKLKKYKVISTTFMSSYRLYDEGINAGYFSHIFVVDASSATEPEAMVPLANFVTAETVVVVSGAPGNHSRWIRSNIARENGLVTSYFERLRDSTMYRGLDAKLMVQLEDREKGMY